MAAWLETSTPAITWKAGADGAWRRVSTRRNSGGKEGSGREGVFFRHEGGAAHLDGHSSLPNKLRAFERQSGAAEGAFRHRPPDIPMGAAASGAVVHLLLRLDDVVAAVRGFMRVCLAGLNHNRHYYILS